MMWSKSDNYFVSGSLKVYSVDFSFEPLKLVPEENVSYDGPKGNDFKSFLFDNGFRVNRQGKAIVGVPKRNGDEDYNFFLLERVIQLGPYGFTNVPSPTVEVRVLKNLLEETRADLAKKNAEVDELHRAWNSEQLRLTLDAITESLKKVFVGVDDLKPPASGDPKSVLRFFEKLRDLIGRKEEFGATFLVAANEILASIATTFYKRTGLSIGGMETMMSSPSTPADLIKSLSTFREFMGNRFFIDGSVMVKDFRLMNEKDIPVIFRDSEADVVELYRKEKGVKSIDNIDGKSIFYGYFNIPSVGKFKGILTRVNFTLPDEIMVKLHEHIPDDERFWFVKANGETLFEKSRGSKGHVCKPENVEFTSPRILGNGILGGDGSDFMGFLRRMNRTFVNKQGTYLKFDFTAILVSGAPPSFDNSVHYYDEDFKVSDPFSKVQFNTNENPAGFLEGRVSMPREFAVVGPGPFKWILEYCLGMDSAFVFYNFCFSGKITKVSGDSFRKNALVTVFFEHNQLGEDCYVDALATTFFVFNPTCPKWWQNTKKVVPKIISQP